MKRKINRHIRLFLARISRYNQAVNTYLRAAEHSPDPAMAYVNWGIDLAQEGRIEEAIHKFEKASEIAPGRFESYMNWGVALAKLNRLDEAIEKFRLAVQKDAKAVSPHILWAAALMEQGKTTEAREKYERAIALNPANPEPYVNWSIALARTGAYHEAIGHLRKALAIQGYQPQLYFLWGAILAELQDYSGAIEKFRMTVQYMPRHWEAYYFWSVALNRLGRYEDALEKSRKAMELEKGKPEIPLGQGDIFSNMSRWEEAIVCYRRALEQDPDLADAHLGWGVALCRLNRDEEGFAHFKTSLELQPDLIGVHQQWGQVLLDRRQYAQALPHLRIAAEQEPDHLEGLLNLAMALIKTDGAEEAVALLFEIEKKDKWNPQAHYLLGTHFMGVDDLPEARRHLELALDAKPDYDDAAINLALTLCEMDDSLEAVRRMRPILRRAPESPRINFFYGVILYRHGDYDGAATKYQKALSLEPDWLEAEIGLGEALLRLHREADAEACFRRILENHPESVSTWFLLGICLLRRASGISDPVTGRLVNEEGLQCFERVIALDPEHLDALANRALMAGRLKSADAMNEAFTRLLEESAPKHRATLLYYWGKALEQQGDRNQAEEKAILARREDPQIDTRMARSSL